MAKYNPDDPSEIQVEDFVAALGDIAEVAPELVEYMLTCYPPELMLHMSPEICQRLEASRKLESQQDDQDS